MNQVKKTIFFSVFISYLGLSVILPILAPIVRELGLSESQAGWMVSIGSISMAIMGPLWGRWSDQIGRKPIMMMGMIGISISYLLYTLVVYVGFQRWLEVTTIFILLVLARTLVGAFIPAVPSTAQPTWLTSQVPEKERLVWR
nr:MFS transporter [Caldalkalibacillus mannanilyticus]